MDPSPLTAPDAPPAPVDETAGTTDPGVAAAETTKADKAASADPPAPAPPKASPDDIVLVYQGQGASTATAYSLLPQRDLTRAEVTAWVRTADWLQAVLDETTYRVADGRRILLPKTLDAAESAG